MLGRVIETTPLERVKARGYYVNRISNYFTVREKKIPDNPNIFIPAIFPSFILALEHLNYTRIVEPFGLRRRFQCVLSFNARARSRVNHRWIHSR